MGLTEPKLSVSPLSAAEERLPSLVEVEFNAKICELLRSRSFRGRHGDPIDLGFHETLKCEYESTCWKTGALQIE